MITRVDPEFYLEQMNLAESMVLRIRHTGAQVSKARCGGLSELPR
jgi:hypothetical protein